MPKKPQAPSISGKKKVLVIDNSKLIVTLMTTFLEREGHEVMAAEDAFTALDMIKEFIPQVIYIDLVMPKIGGDILCRIFRTFPQLKDSFIVIVSAAAAEEHINFIEIGADACIAKGPFSEMSGHIIETLAESDHPRRPPPNPKIRGLENLHSRQITQELLVENKHLQILLESMSQGVVEILDKRVTYANPAALSFFKITAEKGVGSYLDQVIDPATWKQLAPFIETRVDSPASEEDDPTLQIHDRHIIPQCLKKREDSQDQILLLTDITERKKMEAIIEAKNLNENLDYIFSGIRHEIGNPVNSLKMALTVLNKNIDTYDKTTIAEFIDRSLQEVIRIEYLLKALKNFNLYESPDLRNIRIDYFIKNFIPLVQDDLKSKNIDIRTIIGQEVATVYTDSRALHHILLNLLSNAADAVQGKDSPRIIISIASSPPWVKIKIDDNGCGIPESEQKNLFKPFFTSKARGTGLGLIIVKKMLMKLNGKISLQSDPHFGTTVTITLPEGQ
jgi:signal transduction histidine kinase